MPVARNGKQSREERMRLRAYQARKAVHERTLTRRRRDNILASIALVVVLVAAVAAQLLYFEEGPGATVATPSPTPTPAEPPGSEDENPAPSPDLAEGRTWTGTLTLNDIPLSIELDGAAAPQAVAAEITLAQEGFYDGLTCHRLTDTGIFVLQCGDPNGDGSGGPQFRYGPIENAPADDVYPAGTIAMARQANQAESMGSQFFIVYADSTIPSDSAGGYSVIGRVTSGLDRLQSEVIDAGVSEDGVSPAVPVTINGFTVE